MCKVKLVLRICASLMCGMLLVSQSTYSIKAEEVNAEIVTDEIVNAEIDEEIPNEIVIDEVVGAVGEEFIYGEYKFRQVDVNELCVVEYLGSSSDITIPTDANGAETGHYGTVVYIDDNFLYNKTISEKITSVTISKYVVDIGDNAFRDCRNLKKITFDRKAISEMFGDDSNSYREYKFNLKSIGNYAFSGDVSLESIDLSPQGIKSIGDYAFYGCTGLKIIKLSKTIGYIGYNAFLNCTGLEDVYYESEAVNWAGIVYGKDSNENESAGSHPNYYANNTYFFEIKRGYGNVIEKLGYYQPVSLNLNAKISEVGCYVFYNFKSLTNAIVCGPSMIGSYAFGNCTLLSDIEIHNTATTIGNNIFYGCSNLWNVRVHQNTVIESKIQEQKGKEGTNSYNVVPMSEDGCGDGSTSGGDGPGTGGDGPGTGGESGSGEVDPPIDIPTEDDPVATIDKACAIMGYSATYDGSLGLRFFFSIKTDFKNDSTNSVSFKIPNSKDGYETKKIFLKDLECADGIYIYTAYISPKDVDSNIYFQFADGAGNKGTEKSISYYKYLINVENTYSGRDSYFAAKMILRYCDACQRYFNYHENSVDEKYMLESYYYDNMTCDTEYTAIMSDSRFIGFSIILDNELSFRLYFKGKVTLPYWDTISTIDYCDYYTTYTISNLKFGSSFVNGEKNANSFKRKIEYYDENGAINTMWCVYSYLNLALQSEDSDTIYLAKVILYVDENFPYVKTDLSNGDGAFVSK